MRSVIGKVKSNEPERKNFKVAVKRRGSPFVRKAQQQDR